MKQQDEEIFRSDVETEKYDEQFERLPFYRFTDMDVSSNVWLLRAFRVFSALFLSYNLIHPDEYWQATEVAYSIVYGDRLKVNLPWEWESTY